MRHFFIPLTLGLFMTFAGQAQVKIGGTAVAPVASAVLELDGGSNRGLLLPRMRKIDIDAIVNPAEGLTIYATDEQATYLRRSLNWVKLNGDADAFSLPTKMFFNHDDYIFYLQNTGSGACIGGNNIGTGPGVRGFSFKSIGVNGVAQEEVLGIGGYFVNNGGGRSLISMNFTGIGTYVPDALLHIDGATTAGATMIMDDDTDPVVEWRKAGAAIGYLKYTSTYMETQQKDGAFNWTKTGFQSLMGLRVKPGGSGGALVVTNSIGIGSFGGSFPEANLHVIGTPNDYNYTMLLQQTGGDPLIALQNDGVDRGYIQLVGNDMKLGTYATNDPGRVVLRTNGFDRMWVDSVGYVTIGTNAKVGPVTNGPYKLAVRGKIAATEFNVIASGSWPDYVFADDYKLQSLEETEMFIKANKHLPNIPAASVIDKEGFALGDMQKRMMEKIEELTLHLIEANKEIQILKAQMAERK